MKQEKILFGYFKYSIKKLLMYRVYLISELVGSLLVPILISYFLWKSLLETNQLGYDLKGMMMYIVISNLILLFTQIHAEHELENDIKTYRLGQKLLRPINYLKSVSYSHIFASVAVFTILYLPIIVLSLFFLDVNIQMLQIGYFAITLIIGLLLNSLFSFIIGLLSFWLTEIWGVAAIRDLLTSLLSGAIFPLDILPTNIEKIMLMTPFPYMTYIPSKVITDPNFNVKTITSGLMISLAWVIGLTIITYLLVRNGFKKYTSNGA